MNNIDINGNELGFESFFYNTIFSRENTMILARKASDPHEFKRFIMNNIFPTRARKGEERDDIYLDFLCLVYQFCQKHNFSVEKLSTLLSMVDFLFNTSLQQKLTSLDSFEKLKDMLKRHSSQSEPFSIGIFSKEDTSKILKFMRDSFYKFYSLHEVTFTKFIDYNIYLDYKFEETWPTSLKKLDDGQIIDPSSLSYLDKYVRKIAEPQLIEQVEDEEATFEKEVDLGQEEGQYQEEDEGQEDQSPERLELEKEIIERVNYMKVSIENTFTKEEELLNRAEDIINPKKKK